MSWSVRLSRRAEKDLKQIDRGTAARVTAALESYAATERGDVRKLVDVNPPEWRLRVGEYRVIFARDAAAGALNVLRVLPRGEAYR